MTQATFISGRGWKGLPKFSQYMYETTYFLPEETYEGWLERVTDAYKNDDAHKERMKTYIQNYWFHPSTPPSSNAGTNRGLPISCFTKSVLDDKQHIFQNYNEAFNLGAYGGGIGTTWSEVREVGAAVGPYGGESGGVIPFMGISDRSTLGISQGGLRRASEAVYLDVSHPEIEEFIDLRKPTGDQNRRCPNLHHGVALPDAFMKAVITDSDWDLISPKTGKIVKTVRAKKLFHQILEVRQTLKGEPYLLFIDTVNKLRPMEYVKDNVWVRTSNLCTEITLRTDEKHSGVCCLGSANLEYWDEYAADPKVFKQFIADLLDYLDNILQDFIDRTDGLPGFERARAGAIDERSIGLGVMGFHSYLQYKNVPYESAIAKGINKKIFAAIKETCDAHNIAVNKPCPMALRTGSNKRNIHCTAIAPTMSISNLCNMTSSCTEPWLTNAFSKKLSQGTVPIQNKYLKAIIEKEAIKHCGELTEEDWIDLQWTNIKKAEGSVMNLDWMDQWTKEVFKTAFEIDQRWIVSMAGDRAPYIDQAQSTNIFIPGGSHVQTIADIHILAWVTGNKSLYYLKSSAKFRASTFSNERKTINTNESLEDMMKDTCVGCA